MPKLNNPFFDKLIASGAPQSMIDMFYQNLNRTPPGHWKDESDKKREETIKESPFIEDLELDQDGVYQVTSKTKLIDGRYQ